LTLAGLIRVLNPRRPWPPGPLPAWYLLTRYCRHWFRLMSDSHEQFCWTSRWCRVMLLRRAIALSSGGDDDDIDPHAMPLLSWEKRRGPAHLHHTMWRTPDPVPLCTLCTVFFRNTPDSYCPVENTHCPRGASPGSADGGGRHQRGDTSLWRE
jgi:hypothetical protein